MRVHHIQGLFAPEHGGPTHSLSNYCMGQALRGCDVSAWVLSGLPETSAVHPMPLPIQTHIFEAGWPGVLGRSGKMRHHLAQAGTPDIYHLHGTWLRAMHYAAKEARRRNVPFILETMGMYEPYGLRTKWLRKAVARRWFQDAILHHAACLHVGSQQEGESLRQLGFKQPMAVIPVGVEISDVKRGGECPWPQIDGRRFFLYLSRIHEKKGIEMLLETWARLEKQFPDFILLAAGGGAPRYEAACRRQLSDRGLSARCFWTGPLSEVEKRWAYSNASFYVLPSFSENFGNTVAEALAHGTPVVTTDTTPWSDLKRLGCGWIASPTPASLQVVLEEALRTSPDTLISMGQRGQDWARNDFSLDSVIRKIEATYRWVITNTDKPAWVTL